MKRNPRPGDAAALPGRPAKTRGRITSPYPSWFYLPAGVVYRCSSSSRRSPRSTSASPGGRSSSEFIGLDNFVEFFSEPGLVKGFVNTLIYAIVTSGARWSSACSWPCC